LEHSGYALNFPGSAFTPDLIAYIHTFYAKITQVVILSTIRPFMYLAGVKVGYKHALLTTYGEWYQPERRGARGASPNLRRRPLPDLLYAQVVKKRAKGRVVAVSTHVVFGELEAVAAYLATSPVSQTVNTSFVERDNLTQRQSNRRLTRRTNGFSKDLTWFEKQLWVSLAYYHLVLPHKRLQEPLPTPEPTRGVGSPRKWCPVTPAMAAGLTDHVWTTNELLSYRVSAACLDQLRESEHLFPSWDALHHGS
jgi:hypothetical protein